MKVLVRFVLPAALTAAAAIAFAAYAFGADGPGQLRSETGLLKGWYSFRLDSPNAELSLVGVIDFDGNGNVLQARTDYVDGGVDRQDSAACCNYFVGADGRGTLTFFCPDGICQQFHIVLADSGRLVYVLREPFPLDERDLSGEMTQQ
jgi:hypothetical protein